MNWLAWVYVYDVVQIEMDGGNGCYVMVNCFGGWEDQSL